MKHAARTALAWTLAAFAAAGCDRRGTGGSPADVDGARAEANVRARARTADGDAVATPDTSRLDALLVAWRDAETGGDARRAAEEALVAAGPGAIDRLLARVATAPDEWEDAAHGILPLFGDAALDRVLDAIRDGPPSSRAAAIGLLWAFSPSAFDGPRGVEVCRVLLALARSDDDSERSRALERLAFLRPAAAAVAADLAVLWRDADESVRFHYSSTLTALHTDAAPAAPVIAAWLRSVRAGAGDDGEETFPDAVRVVEAFEILASIGTAAPSILPDLRAILASGPSKLRVDTAVLLVRWGDEAAPSAPELVALLRDADEDVRLTAARTLAAIPACHAAARGPILEALTDPDESRQIGSVWDLHGMFRDEEFGTRLAAAVPSLPAESIPEFCHALSEAPWLDASALVRTLLARPDEDVRRAALDLWARTAPADAAPPTEVAALLADADPSLRIRTAQVLVGRPGVDPTRLRDLALDVLAVPGCGIDALVVLGKFAGTDPKALDAVVGALDSPDLCLSAMAHLPPGDVPVPGRHAAVIEKAIGRMFDLGDLSRYAREVVRLEGGAEALVAALGARLEAAAAASTQEQQSGLRTATHAVNVLGPRAAPLRPVLARIYRALPAGAAADSLREEIDRALAEIDGDLEALALTAWANRATVERFLAAGDGGRRALVLYAGRRDVNDETWTEMFGDVRADDAIVAAAAARAETDPYARERRTGAARLAPTLPVAEARAVLRTLSRDDTAEVRTAAVEAWRRLHAIDATSVSAADVAPLLTDDSGNVEFEAIRLAAALGPRGADLVPALRRFRDDRSGYDWAHATVALWRIMRDPDETLPALRAWMAAPERARQFADNFVVWADLRAALVEMPWTVGDVPAIVRVVSDVPAAREAFVPLLARFGPDAAAAVPVLRRLLAELPPMEGHAGEYFVEEGWQDTEGHAIARVLVAIGPAARPAIPDLRWRIAEIGDARGVLGDAIRTLSASGR